MSSPGENLSASDAIRELKSLTEAAIANAAADIPESFKALAADNCQKAAEAGSEAAAAAEVAERFIAGLQPRLAALKERIEAAQSAIKAQASQLIPPYVAPEPARPIPIDSDRAAKLGPFLLEYLEIVASPKAKGRAVENSVEFIDWALANESAANWDSEDRMSSFRSNSPAVEAGSSISWTQWLEQSATNLPAARKAKPKDGWEDFVK